MKLILLSFKNNKKIGELNRRDCPKQNQTILFNKEKYEVIGVIRSKKKKVAYLFLVTPNQDRRTRLGEWHEFGDYLGTKS